MGLMNDATANCRDPTDNLAIPRTNVSRKTPDTSNSWPWFENGNG
jgi:hypothetical protein